MATKTMVRVGAPDPVKDEKFEVMGKDRFGNPLMFRGKLSEPAIINSALRSHPRSVAEIASETGLAEKRVLQHLIYWKNSGKRVGIALVKYEDGTWSVNT